MSDLLQEAINARESGNFTLAKQLTSQALVQHPGNEAAWMLMADLVDDAKLRRNCLERVLAINPSNSDASEALARLNTSPLSPVSRGERDKPINPPTIDKTPPFTAPFTWENQQEEFLALGDMTYPDLPGDKQEQPPETTPTFDWANDSPEPDKTINKIFDAVSNPELASQPLEDTKMPWEDGSDTSQESATEPVPAEAEEEDVWTNEGGSTLVEDVPQGRVLTREDFSVNAEPQMGLHAFISPEDTIKSVTSDFRLWDNPKSRKDRLILLSIDTLTIASPRESDIPEILGLYAEKKLVRDLFGKNTRDIQLLNVHRVTANPRSSRIVVEHKKEAEKTAKVQFTFSNREARDDFLQALLIRLGPGASQKTETFSLGDKIIPPVVTLMIIAMLAWGLIYGVPLLSGLPEAQGGSLQSIVASLQNIVSVIGVLNIFLVALILGLLTLISLLNNLRKPTRLIVVER